MQKKKIKIPSFIIMIVGILITTGITFIIVKAQKSKDRKEIETRIDEIFQGKDEISDYENSGVQGEMEKVIILNEMDISSRRFPGIYAGEICLMSKPTIENENNYWEEERLKKWNTYKELVEYYRRTSGGFNIISLKKMPNGFDRIVYNSKNMGFKVPASEYRAGVNYGYGVTSAGYSIPTYRGTVQQAYNLTLDFLTKDKENSPYIPGSYNKIKTFDELSSEFYYIRNIAPTIITSSSNNAISWNSSSDASVFNPDWIVWYEYYGKHYEIVEDKTIFYMRWAKYSAIGAILVIGIFFGNKFRKKFSFDIS